MWEKVHGIQTELIFMPVYVTLYHEKTLYRGGKTAMTAQELEQKYIGRMTDEDKLNDQFHMMGKFGKASMYTFSFNT